MGLRYPAGRSLRCSFVSSKPTEELWIPLVVEHLVSEDSKVVDEWILQELIECFVPKSGLVSPVYDNVKSRVPETQGNQIVLSLSLVELVRRGLLPYAAETLFMAER